MSTFEGIQYKSTNISLTSLLYYATKVFDSKQDLYFFTYFMFSFREACVVFQAFFCTANASKLIEKYFLI